MENLGGTILATAVSVVITLVVTLIFNKLVAIPRARRQQEEGERQEREAMRQEIEDLKAKTSKLQTAIDALPTYRAQSIQIQSELRAADTSILEACAAIKDSICRLERREKNALRQKLLTEYRLFTDLHKNPMQAWTEMEHHAFFELVHDYEALGGNDYVHSTVLPAMNELDMIPMEDTAALARLMSSRQM